MDGGDGKFWPGAERDAAIIGGGEVAGLQLLIEVRAVRPLCEAEPDALLRVESADNRGRLMERDEEKMRPARDAQAERRGVADAQKRGAAVIHVAISHRGDHGHAITGDSDPCPD